MKPADQPSHVASNERECVRSMVGGVVTLGDHRRVILANTDGLWSIDPWPPAALDGEMAVELHQQETCSACHEPTTRMETSDAPARPLCWSCAVKERDERIEELERQLAAQRGVVNLVQHGQRFLSTARAGLTTLAEQFRCQADALSDPPDPAQSDAFNNMRRLLLVEGWLADLNTLRERLTGEGPARELVATADACDGAVRLEGTRVPLHQMHDLLWHEARGIHPDLDLSQAEHAAIQAWLQSPAGQLEVAAHRESPSLYALLEAWRERLSWVRRPGEQDGAVVDRALQLLELLCRQDPLVIADTAMEARLSGYRHDLERGEPAARSLAQNYERAIANLNRAQDLASRHVPPPKTEDPEGPPQVCPICCAAAIAAGLASPGSPCAGCADPILGPSRSS